MRKKENKKEKKESLEDFIYRHLPFTDHNHLANFTLYEIYSYMHINYKK